MGKITKSSLNKFTRLRNMSKVFLKINKEVGTVALIYYKDNYENQLSIGRPATGARTVWKALKKSTITTKKGNPKTRRNAERILIGTGLLLGSLSIIKHNVQGVTLGVKGKAKNYAKYHQTPRGGGKLPHRPFYYQSKEIDRKVRKIIEKNIKLLFKL